MMKKNNVVGAALGALMLLPLAAQAQMLSLTNPELAGVSGAGYVVSFNNVIKYPIPALTETDFTYHGVDIGQIARTIETKNPTLVANARTQLVNTVNTAVMPVVNVQLRANPFLRYLTPVSLSFE